LSSSGNGQGRGDDSSLPLSGGRRTNVERWERWDNVRGSSVPECFGHNSGQWRDVPDDELGGRFVRRPPLSGNEESSLSHLSHLSTLSPLPRPTSIQIIMSWFSCVARTTSWRLRSDSPAMGMLANLGVLVSQRAIPFGISGDRVKILNSSVLRLGPGESERNRQEQGRQR
jgi:hypothetical protein